MRKGFEEIQYLKKLSQLGKDESSKTSLDVYCKALSPNPYSQNPLGKTLIQSNQI